MKTSDILSSGIPFASLHFQWETPAPATRPRRGEEIVLEQMTGEPGRALLKFGNMNFPIRPAGQKSASLFVELYGRSTVKLALVAKADEDLIVLEIAQFSGIRQVQPLRIHVDGNSADVLERFGVRLHGRGAAREQNGAQWLNESFLEEAVFPKTALEQQSARSRRRRAFAVTSLKGSHDRRSLILVGAGIHAVLVPKEDQKDLSWRLLRLLRGQPRAAGFLEIIEGEIAFTSHGGEEFRLSVAAELESLTEQKAGSLLQAWRRFGELESFIGDQERYRFGILAVEALAPEPGGVYGVRASRPRTALTFVCDGEQNCQFDLENAVTLPIFVGGNDSCHVRVPKALCADIGCAIGRTPDGSWMVESRAIAVTVLGDEEPISTSRVLQNGAVLSFGVAYILFNEGDVPLCDQSLCIAPDFPKSIELFDEEDFGLNAEDETLPRPSRRDGEGQGEKKHTGGQSAAQNRQPRRLREKGIKGKEVSASRKILPQLIEAARVQYEFKIRSEMHAGSDVVSWGAGWMWVDSGPEFVARKRRQKAFEALMQGKSGIPDLGLVLAGRMEKQPPRKVVSMSKTVMKRVFPEHPPTEMQRKAIDICLNTTDIALVQGPPGTGKTTVIRAVVESILEDFDPGDELRGCILLSGFQHDAVENVVEKVKALGLPPIKVGQRRNDADAQARVEVEALNWSWARAEHIRPTLKARPEHALTRQLRDLHAELMIAHLSPAGAALRLRPIMEQLRQLLPLARAEAVVRALRSVAGVSSLVGNPRIEPLRRAIYSLRTSAVSFGDDGPQCAGKFLRLWHDWVESDDLAGEISEEDENLLVAGSEADRSEPGSDLLDRLCRLRRRLLLDINNQNQVTGTFVLLDLAEAVVRAADALDQSRSVNTPEERIDSVLHDWVDELESNPIAVAGAIATYTAVYGATCQQSAAVDLLRMKQKGEWSPEQPVFSAFASYDTVIIDEAARSTALDLLIPMVQAARRVILVGDHRQLPQIVDNALEERLETDEDIPDSLKELVEKPFFQQLFDQMRGAAIKPQRCITLDQQFRMHPELGDLVSTSFYGLHHPDEAFKSPLGAEEFAHHIAPFAPHPCAWIHVSGEEREQRDRETHSLSRIAEAAEVAKIVQHILDEDKQCQLTIGIITFYRKQKTEIERQLEKLEIMERETDGGLALHENKRFVERAGKRHARMAVGTVDAFQGREFDVVILSVVRTLREKTNVRRSRAGKPVFMETAELNARRRFGHLISPNRLCVAMSRQERLLIVVGDKECFSDIEARDHVPALATLLDLCCAKETLFHREKEGILKRNGIA